MPAHVDPIPLDPRVAVLVTRMSEAQYESFGEAAAIREYEGCLDRATSEREALLDILSRASPGVRAFRLELPDGGCLWAVAVELSAALAHLHMQGGNDIAEVALDNVLRDRFGGFALLVAPT